MRWRCGVAAIGAAVVLISGCTGGADQPSQTPTAGSTSSASAPVASATPQPTQPAPSPDPSTAGSLTADSMPQAFLGFTPKIRPPREGEFNANGTWVFGTDPTRATTETWPRCKGDVPEAGPTAVLLASYADESDAPGIGQAFEFATPEAATAWLAAYGAELEACRASSAPPFPITELDVSPDLVLDRRLHDDKPWSERVWTKGSVLFFMIVQRDVTLAELKAAV